MILYKNGKDEIATTRQTSLQKAEGLLTQERIQDTIFDTVKVFN